MKNKFLIVSLMALFCIGSFAPVDSQCISLVKAKSYAAAHPLKSIDITKLKTVPNPLPQSGTIIYLTPSLGVTPIQLQKVNGSWQAVGSITPTVAYGIGIGGYNTDANGIEVQPYVSLSAFVGGGITAAGGVNGSVQAGAMLGIYKWLGIGYSYDFVSKQAGPLVSAKFDIFNFRQGAGATILKLF